MSEQYSVPEKLPETAPFWAQVMYSAQQDGFRGVHSRIDRVEDEVDANNNFRVRHETQHDERDKAIESKAKKRAGIFATAGTILGTIGGAIVGGLTGQQ